MSRQFVVTQASINTPRDEALAIVSHDPALCAVIDEVADNTTREGVEIFHREGNCLVTERGYIYAFWADDLQIVSDD